MRLGSLIRKKFVLTGDRFKSVLDAADALIDLIVQWENIPVSAAEAKRIVHEREKLGGTFLPPGVAIPHGRIEGFNDLMLGIWVPKTTLQTEGGPVKILILAISTTGSGALYLSVLASIGKVLSSEDYLNSLMGQSASDIHKELNSIVLQEEITISDIMTSAPITCTPETSLGELINTYVGKNLSYLPVVDDNGKMIAEVSVKDVLSAGLPDYIRRLGNVKFLKTLQSFETLLQDEGRLKVNDIMRPMSRSIAGTASIIEAAILITTKGYRHIPVVEDGIVIGVVSETDILKKILRGEIWHN